jgi:predicted nucleic acid-binding protein
VTVYADTSSLVKLFITEPGSEDVRERLSTASLVFSSEVAYPEVRAALARRRREAALTGADFKIAKEAFEERWRDVIAISTTTPLCREAGELAERYELRGFDSIHLASFAEMLRALQGSDDVEFSSFDDRLNAAARKLARRLR